MLANIVLKDMTANDLTQRYAESFISYGSEIIYCTAFDGNRIYYKRADRRDGTGIFHWELLDTSRPVSQWYPTKNGPQYLQYSTNKQFSRGFSRNTCQFYMPELDTCGPGYDNLKACFFDKPYKRSLDRLMAKDVQVQLDENKTVQLNPMIVVTPRYILFRKTVIGELKKAEFHLHRPEFAEEIIELIDNPVIKIQPFRPPEKKKLKIEFNIDDPPPDFQDYRFGLRRFNKITDINRDRVVLYSRTAVFPEEETIKVLESMICGSQKCATRHAESFKTSFIWWHDDIGYWRIGFHR